MWTPVALSRDVPPLVVLPVVAGGRELALWRSASGRIAAWADRCPHRGIALEWLPDQFLDHSGSLIQCATHGALFLIESGECVAGPCAGQMLQTLACQEQDGSIWVSL